MEAMRHLLVSMDTVPRTSQSDDDLAKSCLFHRGSVRRPDQPSPTVSPGLPHRIGSYAPGRESRSRRLLERNSSPLHSHPAIPDTYPGEACTMPDSSRTSHNCYLEIRGALHIQDASK